MSVDPIENLILPYRSESLPGIGGQLRVTPRHFVVEEVPLYAPQDEGSHLYLCLTKEGMTTREVVATFEQLFQLRPGEVGYAGLKDKFARTSQVFSIPVAFGSGNSVSPESQAARIQEMVEQICDQMPVQVAWARLHRNKLKVGHLLGNHFRIVICDLAEPVEVALPKAEAIAEFLRLKGLPNYFGSQRFGKEGDNPLQGREILLNQRRVRDHWLRQFLISSYQSHLCNLYLAQRMQRGCFDQLLLGDIAKKHTTGGLFEVADAATEQPRFDAQEISFTAPMFGFKMKAATADAGQLEAEIARSAGIEAAQWRAARVEGTRRMGRLLVPDLTVSPWQEKEKRAEEKREEEKSAEDRAREGLLVEFFLPKGAFATTVLRELMKPTQHQTAEENPFAAIQDEATPESE